MITDLFFKQSFFHIEKTYNLNLDLKKLEKDFFYKKMIKEQKNVSNITNTFISYILQTPIKNPMHYLSNSILDKINVIDYNTDIITNITNDTTNRITNSIIEFRYN
jgi:hypothetical protein